MPAVPYIYSGPWWSAANLNRLSTEFDRRLTLALAGKTPYLLMGYGGTVGYISGNLPVAYTTPNIRGIGAPTGIISGPAFGPCYVFKGSDAPIHYFEFTDAWNQAALDTWANGLTEVSHDLATHTVKVDITSPPPPFNLEESLRVNTRDISGVVYRLWATLGATPQNPDRALRRHQYAVAELACEGLANLAVPLIWDRYEKFRVHNLSGIELTVTVELPDDAHGDPVVMTFTVPPFGCRSFRRRGTYFDASLNYGWRARAGIDKRFHVPGGDGWPERSACASNIARPEGLFDWLRGLQAERDPRVAMPAITSELFGNPNSDSTLIGDLIAHKGPMHSLGWTLVAPFYDTIEGNFTGHANIVADFLAMGITATVVGNLVTLARGGTAPGEPGSGLDLVAKGTNLLWCPDQNYPTGTVPGSPAGFVPQRVRQYTPLTITLVEDIPLTIEGRYLNEVTTTTTTYSESGRWETVASPTVSIEVGGYDPANTIVGRMDTVAAQNLLIAGPADNDQTPWSLTPEGFISVSKFVHSIQASYTHSSTANRTEMWESGLYSELSGAEITHRAFIGHNFPGWSTRDQPYAFAPRPRKLGHLAFTGANWESGDWDGEQVTDEGGEPIATGKTIEDRPDLVWLRNPGQPTVPDHDRAGRYFLYHQPDEGRDGVDAPRADYRVIYAQGGHSVPGVFWRRPMQVEDWNHMAWCVNAWTRARPLMDISLVYLGGYGSGAPTHVFSNLTMSGGGGPWTGIRPAEAYNLLPETDVAAWTAFGVTVNDSRDAQGWSTAKAALLAMKDWTYNNVATVSAVTFVPEYFRLPAGPGVENIGEYYSWNVNGTVSGPVLVGDSVSTAINYDYDVYSPIGDDAVFWYVPISEIANLADSLGMPCTWISQGVAWQLEVFHEGPPTWANSGTYTVPTFSEIWQYQVFTGDPGIPPPALPALTPDLGPHVFALNFEQVRFTPAASPAEIGWFANLGTTDRWGNWGLIWKTLGRQLYGEFRTPSANSTWNPWANLDPDLYTLGGFVGFPGTPAPPTGPAKWILDYGMTEEFRDRDAQIEQKAGVWVHGSGYTGLHFPRVIKGASWWINYDEDAIWIPAQAGVVTPPGTTFATPGGSSNSEELDAGPNLITASEGQAFGVLVSGEIYVDLG